MGLSSHKAWRSRSQPLRSRPPPSGRTLPAAQAAQPPALQLAGAWMEPASPSTQMRGLRPKPGSGERDTLTQLVREPGWVLSDRAGAGACLLETPPAPHRPHEVLAGSRPPFFLGRSGRTGSRNPLSPLPVPLHSAWEGVPLPAPPPCAPRAFGPVWAAPTALEPSAGKPRRTGRHSSFYRPSNWGWSRRGNTKILCTQLLSVRGRRPGSGAARDAFVLPRAPRLAPGSALNRRH